MSDQVTVNLSDHAAHWVHWYSQMTGRSTSQVVGETVERSLSQMKGESADLSRWSDDEILAAADSSMPPQVEDRLEELLSRQDDGSLAPADREELDAITR